MFFRFLPRIRQKKPGSSRGYVAYIKTAYDMGDLVTLLNFLQFSSLPFNALDVVVLGVIAFYAYEGYTVGFLIAVLDLLSFILSFLLALFFYSAASTVFITLFS